LYLFEAFKYIYLVKIKIILRIKYTAILFLILGIILKLENWPGASESLIISALLGIVYCGYRVVKGQ